MHCNNYFFKVADSILYQPQGALAVMSFLAADSNSQTKIRWLICLIAALGVSILAYQMTLHKLSNLRDQGGEPFFYQLYYEPAVLVACGYEFGWLKDGQPKPLEDFLRLKFDALDCSVIPKNPEIVPAEFIMQWYYKLNVAAVYWKALGVSWTALDHLSATLVALSILGIFAISRLFLPTFWSLGFAGIILFTQPYFYFAAYLRDLSKAPFIILILFLLIFMLMLKNRYIKLHHVAIALLAGALIGYGIGFRPDVLIVLPLAIFMIFFMLPGFQVRQVLKKIGLIALLGSTFFLMAYPILSAGKANGSCGFHFPLLGFGKQFSNALEIDQGSFGLAYTYMDDLAFKIVESHASRNFDTTLTKYCGVDYDQASGDLFLGLITTLPSEFLLRSIASTLQLITSPPKVYVDIGKLTFLISMAIILLCMFVKRPWFTFGTILCLFYLLAHPAIQFNLRHYFHLTFIPYMFVTIAVFSGYQIAISTKDKTAFLHNFATKLKSPNTIKKIFLFFAIILLAPYITLSALRSYQTIKLDELAQRYTHFEWRELTLSETADANGAGFQILDVDELSKGASLIRIDIDTKRCMSSTNDITVDYVSHNESSDYSRNLRSLAGEGRNISGTHYQQVYRTSDTNFTSLVMPPEFRPCILSISYATSGDFSGLWLDLHTQSNKVASPYSTLQ